MKSISEDMHEGEAREPFFGRELFKFRLEVIALIGAAYVVHLFIHMW